MEVKMAKTQHPFQTFNRPILEHNTHQVRCR